MSAPLALAYAPSLIEKLFALRQVQPFDRLPPDELALLAEVARPRSYAPGEMIHPGEAPLTRLLVVVSGRAVDGVGEATGPILGMASLIKDLPAPRVLADPGAGVRMLDISKRHFFTLARECPEFVLGLIELGEHGKAAP
jgi:signal-transduction protein with cAMP-binding, CBS, and nucleotidyltransferase domain